MPEYLIIILAITACLIIVATLYGIILIRRSLIVMKKIDYLVEDLTYKSEILSPTIDSLLKLSSYVNVMEDVIKRNALTIKNITKNNAPAIKKYINQLEKALNEK